MSTRKRTAILISGRGSNMMSLVEAARAPAFPAEIAGVISNRPDAPGIAWAAERQIATHVVDHKAYADREGFEAAIGKILMNLGAELVCLAGFMRVLTPAFVQQWQGRMLNIHPSLLPLFPGLHTYERALDAGVKISGCTVHFVAPEMDAGPIIAQAAVGVRDGDTAESLAQRILQAEHKLYPFALHLAASGAIRMVNGRAVVNAAAATSGMDKNPINYDSVLFSPPLSSIG